MPKCFKGKYLPSKEMTVPCGKCSACLRKKQLNWTSRIVQEWLSHNQKGRPSEFITLTYNDENVPRTFQNVLTLHKAQFTKFLNNVRNAHGPFRYYACGEYGEMYQRPHVHMALFPPDTATADYLTKEWINTNGFAQRKELTSKRCAYLAKYTTKGLTKDKDLRLKRDQEPEFRISSTSPGLGTDFAGVVAAKFAQPSGQAYIEKTGDVARTFKVGGITYPLTDFTLTKIRKKLDIPLKHSERDDANDNYLIYNTPVESTNNPEAHEAQEDKYSAEKRSKLYRTPYRRL
ncbi:replication initiator protein [Microviridae sp.]|nr:replication initiator protein [Microviridae sp.]